jgi:hypothetical protein
MYGNVTETIQLKTGMMILEGYDEIRLKTPGT